MSQAYCTHPVAALQILHNGAIRACSRELNAPKTPMAHEMKLRKENHNMNIKRDFLTVTQHQESFQKVSTTIGVFQIGMGQTQHTKTLNIDPCADSMASTEAKLQIL